MILSLLCSPLVQHPRPHFMLGVGVLRDVVIVAQDFLLADGTGDLHPLGHQVGHVVLDLVISCGLIIY